MSFANGKLAKIWEIKPKENYTEVKISTSRKEPNSDDYIQDFGGFVRFIGKANDKIKKCNGTENIKLISVETTNRYDRAKATMYTNYACFDFEVYTPLNQPKKENSNTQGQTDNNTPPLSDDDPPLPF